MAERRVGPLLWIMIPNLYLCVCVLQEQLSFVEEEREVTARAEEPRLTAVVRKYESHLPRGIYCSPCSLFLVFSFRFQLLVLHFFKRIYFIPVCSV